MFQASQMGPSTNRPLRDKALCSDAFVITQDFVVHGRHTVSGKNITPKIKNTRYKTPVYNLDENAFVLPIYLRFSPQMSSHQKIAFAHRYTPQMRIVLDLLNFPFDTPPDLTWLPDHNY